MSSPIRSVNCSHFVMVFGSDLAFNCMVDSKGPNKCNFFSASGLQDRPQYVTKFLPVSQRAREI